MRLSLHQKNAMKFLQIALMRMNVSERLNLYDRYCEDEILKNTVMNLQTNTLLQHFLLGNII